MRTQILKTAQNVLKKFPYLSEIPLLKTSSSSNSNPKRKVTILNAASEIGKPLSLSLRTNPLVSELSLFDSNGDCLGLGVDLEDIPSRAKVVSYDKYEFLDKALEGSDVVIIPPRFVRPDFVPPSFVGFRSKRKSVESVDLFTQNAGLVKILCERIAKHCPNALVNLIGNAVNPVNSMVPIAAEAFKNAGTYDPKRLFGVTTLNVLRAKTFYAESIFNAEPSACVDPEDVVPVVGGAGYTTLPLFSQVTPNANLSASKLQWLIKRTQRADSECFTFQFGDYRVSGYRRTLTLSAAFAGAVFVDACLKGLNGVPDIVECSYVQSDITEVPFFASKVRLGKNGVEEIMGLGSLSDYEKQCLEDLLPRLKESIDKGIEFANAKPTFCNPGYMYFDKRA